MLGSYPGNHSLMHYFHEVGEFVPESGSYDKLFEIVVELTERRTSQGEAGRVLLERGLQKLHAEKKHDAIRLL